MKKYGIFYGSVSGTTADVARRIARQFGVGDEDIHDVGTTAPDKLGDYEVLILGSSTHGNGELAADWYDFADGAAALDLKGHRIALFGCGDASMEDTFCDAVEDLYERFKDTGAIFIGEYPADCYNYRHSSAQDGATMRGLCLDEVNSPQLTDSRIADWTEQIKHEA